MPKYVYFGLELKALLNGTVWYFLKHNHILRNLKYDLTTSKVFLDESKNLISKWMLNR